MISAGVAPGFRRRTHLTYLRAIPRRPLTALPISRSASLPASSASSVTSCGSRSPTRGGTLRFSSAMVHSSVARRTRDRADELRYQLVQPGPLRQARHRGQAGMRNQGKIIERDASPRADTRQPHLQGVLPDRAGRASQHLPSQVRGHLFIKTLANSGLSPVDPGSDAGCSGSIGRGWNLKSQDAVVAPAVT
jgi:hypothetical protein